MNGKTTDNVMHRALKAVFRVIGDAKLQEKLQDKDLSNEVLKQFDLPQNARQALLDIINRVEQIQARAPTSDIKADAVASSSETKKMLLESFVHIRWSFWISLVMSVVLFLVGLVFLGMAVMRSLSESAVSTSTLTIAGLGVADFVLLFYTRPWQDISVNLSNSQQVKIIATSYLSGLSLLQQGKTEGIKSLEQLTKSSVGLLEEFTEERSPSSGNASKTNKS
jgi:cation transport ATPase